MTVADFAEDNREIYSLLKTHEVCGLPSNWIAELRQEPFSEVGEDGDEVPVHHPEKWNTWIRLQRNGVISVSLRFLSNAGVGKGAEPRELPAKFWKFTLSAAVDQAADAQKRIAFVKDFVGLNPNAEEHVYDIQVDQKWLVESGYWPKAEAGISVNKDSVLNLYIIRVNALGKHSTCANPVPINCFELMKTFKR
jgi:hypothetical protein